MDYVSKWVKSPPCVAADSKSSKKMFQEIIFPCFGVSRVVISDGGSHFSDKNLQEVPQRVRSGPPGCYTIPSPNKWLDRDVQQAN
jgi:hypothetical protein